MLLFVSLRFSVGLKVPAKLAAPLTAAAFIAWNRVIDVVLIPGRY